MSFRGDQHTGFVFAMSNAGVNTVSVFAHSGYGELALLNIHETGGSGSAEAVAGPLQSQGALVRSRNGRFLFAANAGDHTITSFRVRGDYLVRQHVAPSLGLRPVSLAVHDTLLAVLNQGAGGQAGSLALFRILPDGKLEPLMGGVPLSEGARPGCVRLSPNGLFVAVSEAGLSRISVFVLDRSGLVGPIAAGQTMFAPLGLAFSEDGLLLAAEGGADGALSSHFLGAGGALMGAERAQLTGQLGTGWISLHPNGGYAYTSNKISGTVSQLQLQPEGGISLVASVASSDGVAGGPTDNAVDRGGRLLYILNGAEGSIGAFHIGRYGGLEPVCLLRETGLPALGAQGLTAS